MSKEIILYNLYLTVPKYLIAPMIAWIVTQLIKVVHKGLKGSWDWRNFYRSGSMPSSHAAVVMSLVTMIGLSEGVSSVEFSIAAIFAGIVMYDAINVRQAVGQHGIVIKEIMRQHKMSAKLAKSPRFYVRDSFGHTPMEVLVGALAGVLLSLVIFIV